MSIEIVESTSQIFIPPKDPTLENPVYFIHGKVEQALADQFACDIHQADKPPSPVPTLVGPHVSTVSFSLGGFYFREDSKKRDRLRIKSDGYPFLIDRKGDAPCRTWDFTGKMAAGYLARAYLGADTSSTITHSIECEMPPECYSFNIRLWTKLRSGNAIVVQRSTLAKLKKYRSLGGAKIVNPHLAIEQKDLLPDAPREGMVYLAASFDEMLADLKGKPDVLIV